MSEHRQGRSSAIPTHLALMWVVGVQQLDSRLYLFPCRALLGVTQPFIFEGRRSSGRLGRLPH